MEKYLSKEELELYKILERKEYLKSEINKLKDMQKEYKGLTDPWLAKMLNITKQAVFIRRHHLLDKLKRIQKQK